jgi:hypothetical protein
MQEGAVFKGSVEIGLWSQQGLGGESSDLHQPEIGLENFFLLTSYRITPNFGEIPRLIRSLYITSLDATSLRM